MEYIMLNNESFCSENDLCTDVYNEGKERGWFSLMRTMYCLGLCNVHERLTVLISFSWDIVPSGTTLMFEHGEQLSLRHHKCNNKINPWGRGTIVQETSFLRHRSSEQHKCIRTGNNCPSMRTMNEYLFCMSIIKRLSLGHNLMWNYVNASS